MTISITVDIDLSDIDIDDLIEEVESSGYIVLDEDEQLENALTKEELEFLLDKLSTEQIGRVGWYASEKIRKFYNKPTK